MHLVKKRGHLLDLVDEDDSRSASGTLLHLPSEDRRLLGVLEELVVLQQVDCPRSLRQGRGHQGALARLARAKDQHRASRREPKESMQHLAGLYGVSATY